MTPPPVPAPWRGLVAQIVAKDIPNADKAAMIEGLLKVAIEYGVKHGGDTLKRSAS